MPDYEARLQQACTVLNEAEYILLGGGAGLSDAAGLHFSGKRFTDNFAAFIARYGFEDLYTSSFYPFKTQEEKWAYWAKHISINRYEEPATILYKDLFRLVQGKEYFALTSNVESQFHKAGFQKEKIFAVQGDYGYFQCARACHDTLYDNEDQIAEMLRRTADCKIPSSLVPRCPVCAGAMDVYVHKDRYFIRDKQWRDAEKRCTAFLKACAGRRLALLELGVGFNTPGIIRFPFEQLVHANPNATLIRINREHPLGAAENARRTISFTEDMARLVRTMRECRLPDCSCGIVPAEQFTPDNSIATRYET